MAKKRAFLLRLSPELWEDLNCLAKDELRSVNAQIEYILREELRRRRRLNSEASDESKSAPPDD